MRGIVWVMTMLAGAAPCGWACGQASDVPPGVPEQVDTHASETLQSVAERSDYRATARHSEVLATLDALAQAFPQYARRAEMGRSFEDREIPLLILCDPPVSTPDEARELAEREGRVVVLMIGNIHAGEVDGKEAMPMLARDLLKAESPLLKSLVIVMAPIYNCDGNERVGETAVNRPGQVGPDEGCGIRHNAQDLDLNRDFIKLEAPETRALVRFFNQWDPHVFLDAHTTNGSHHRFLLTYAGPKSAAGDARVVDFARTHMFPWVHQRFESTTPWSAFWYGSFGGVFGDKPATRDKWETFPAEARFGTTYVGLRGRLSLLSEAYSYAPYKERVRGTRDFARCVLEYAAAHARDIRAVCAQGDRAAAGRAPGLERIAIRSRITAFPGTVIVKGFEEKTDEQGRTITSDTPKDYECQLVDRVEPELIVGRPVGYVFLADVPKAVEVLGLHGLSFERLRAGTRLECEVYRVEDVRSASRLFQGHALVSVEAEPRRETLQAGEGWVYVRTDQPLGHLASYLLEPECEDGLTVWNFFDEWLKIGGDFPVARVVGPQEPSNIPNTALPGE